MEDGEFGRSTVLTAPVCCPSSSVNLDIATSVGIGGSGRFSLETDRATVFLVLPLSRRDRFLEHIIK